MALQDPHPDGDPLLVRPYILRSAEQSDIPDPPAWPSDETWPAGALRPTREIISHRATRTIALPGAASPARRRRTYVLAGAGAAAVIGLATVGYGLLTPDDDGDVVPIPTGALPPLPTASASTGNPLLPTSPPASAPASPSTSASPAGSRSPSTKAAPATGATTTAAPVAGATTTAAPALVPPTAGLVAALSPAPPAARVGTITGDGNLCLDLNGGVPQDDNHVQVFDCNGTEAQRWTLATDGTLRVVGKCAQVTGDSTVHIIGCDSRAQSQWRAGAGNALVNVATGACLTDPDAGARSGAGVRVAACADTANQQWALP